MITPGYLSIPSSWTCFDCTARPSWSSTLPWSSSSSWAPLWPSSTWPPSTTPTALSRMSPLWIQMTIQHQSLRIMVIKCINQILVTSDQLVSPESDLNPCQLVEMDVSICQIYWASQLLFSLHFLVWNLLVAVVLVSVARTQVAKARRWRSRKTCHLLDDQHSEVSSRAGARCDPSWSSTACQLWETSLKQSGYLYDKTIRATKKMKK